MFKSPYSLRSRALAIVAVVFAVMLSMIAYHTTADRVEDIENAKTHLLHIAQKVSAEQKRIVEHVDRYLLGLMRLPEIRTTSRNFNQWKSAPDPACSRFLAAKLENEPNFLSIGVIALNGDVICNALEPDKTVNVADRPYFKKSLKTHGVVISDLMVGRVSQREQRIIMLARALRDDAQAVRGVVTVSLDLAWLSQQLGEAGLPDGAHLGLFDANGVVVARYPVEEGWVGRDISATEFFKTWRSVKHESTAEMIGLDGTQRIIALTPFVETPGGRISLWISVPKDAVTAHVDREFAWSLALSAAVLLLAFWAIWLAEDRMLLRPLSALVNAVRRLAEGGADVRTGLRHDNSELGQLACAFDDMAQSIEAKEAQVVKATRALRVLSAGNRALLHATDERALLDQVCRVTVEAGGYRMAWVGYAQDDKEKNVRVVACFETPPDFMDAFKVSWADEERGQGPTGVAIRRGIPVTAQNMLIDAPVEPWRSLALRHHYASVLALPLRVDDAIVGALTIHAAEPDAFGDEEKALLGEAAADLSFGIAVQRARTREARLERSLKSAEDRFRAAAEANLDAWFILKSVRDSDGVLVEFQFTDINASAEKMIGMAREKVIGEKLCAIMPIKRNGNLFDKYVKVVTTGTPLEEEFSIESPTIKAKWLRQQVVRVGDGIAISLRDITAWKATSQKLRENEELLRVAMSAVRMGVWSRDVESNTFKMTDEMATLFGLQPGDASRSVEALLNLIHPADREAALRIMSRPLAKPEAFAFEPRTLWPDGTFHWLHVEGVATSDAEGHVSREVGIAIDITERKANEQALARAMRALQTVSAGNEELVRAIDEAELLRAVCRVVVEKGGYRLAAVGYAQDDPQKTIAPVAWAGFEEGYYTQGWQGWRTWADTDSGQMPIARVIRGGKPIVTRSIATDAGYYGHWRDEATRRGYASNLVVPLSDGTRTFGGLSIYSSEPDAFDEEEIRLLTELGNNLAYGITSRRTKAEHDRIAYEHEHHEKLLRTSLEESIQAIADTVDMRDPYTAGHQRRVAKLAVAIAQEMGLSENKIHGIRLAAIVHDLGKLKIPAEILSKPGKLTDIEFMLIKTHAQAGYDILKDIAFPWPIATIVWQHHERLDGSGYPQALKGDQILLESRIMAVADVVEAIASHRPYRPSLGIEAALVEIDRGQGAAYDRDVTDACLRLFRQKSYTVPS